MTDVKLIDLHLHNFKGVNDFTLSTGGNNTSVFGDNATGKTTLADACWWLLGGKDSDGRADFELKRLDETGSPEHHLDHEVEGIFLIGDTKKTLKKVFKEKWTKRRGATEREFDGHSTDHFIDGVPVTAGEFSAIVGEIAPYEVMRLLTDPYQFAASIHWKERRQLLLDVCGDVNDDDVVASNSDLEGFMEVLGGRTLDDHRKVVNSRRKQINDELDQLPVRIDEAERALPDVSELPSKLDCEADLLVAKGKKQGAEQELARIEAGGQAAEKTKELREVEASIQEAKTTAVAQEEEDKKDLRKEHELTSKLLSEARVAITDAETKIERTNGSIERLTTRMDTKRGEWELIDADTFDHNEPDTCAACGQSLPADKVEAAVQKAQEAFNARKSSRLEEVAAEGKAAKEEHDELVAGEADRQAYLSESQSRASDLEEAVKNLDDQIAEISVEPDLDDLNEKKEAIEAEIEALQTDNADEIQKAKEEVSKHALSIDLQNGFISKHQAVKDGQTRLVELRGQEKTLAGEFEELERQLHLMDLFVKSKVDMLTDRINEHFELAHFKLFTILVNGGIEECCEVSYLGVPWGNLNHGAQINVGLDVITTLQKHYGVSLPVWVDQSESITKLPELSCQLIRLVVSPQDQSLRVE